MQVNTIGNRNGNRAEPTTRRSGNFGSPYKGTQGPRPPHTPHHPTHTTSTHNQDATRYTMDPMSPTILLATIGAVVALITPALLLAAIRSGSEHHRPTPKQGDVRIVIDGDAKAFERGLDDLKRQGEQ